MAPADTAQSGTGVVVAVLAGMKPARQPGPGRGYCGPVTIGSGSERRRLVAAFLDIARHRAEHPAIVVGDDRYSYRNVANAAHAVARFLLSRRAFKTGSRVGLAIDNCAEYLAAFYGTLLAGGVVAPIPPNTEASRLTRILSACDVEVVLSTSRIAARLASLGWRACEPIDLGQPSQVPVPEIEPVRIGDQTLAMIMFTSGSTGEPKGVMLSDANLLANASSITRYLPFGRDDRALALLPFCHAYGNSVMQTHLLTGATLVVDGSLAFPNTVLEALRRHEATSFAGVPETYHSLLSYSDLGKEPLPQLRYMTVAGGALEPGAALEVAKRLAPARFYVMYGQSEATARLAYLPPDMLNTRPGSIGKAIPDVQLKVLDDQGRAVPPGQTGELCARGPNVMLGYWGEAEASSSTIKGGWLHTGDLATVDREGYIYVQSRKDDLIKTQGLRTHPREIEELVSRHFVGFRALVLPYRLHNTTRLALYLVSASGELPVDEVRHFCLRTLPRPKVPSYIEVLKRVPLNASMKLDRQRLVRRAEIRSGATGRASRPVQLGSLPQHVVVSFPASGHEGVLP